MKEFLEDISLRAKEIETKLKELTFEDTLVFPLFTDLHTEDAMSDSSQKLFEALKILRPEKLVFLDRFWCGGHRKALCLSRTTSQKMTKILIFRRVRIILQWL